MELKISYKTIYRRVRRFLQALDAPQPQLEMPVEINELYVNAGLKGRNRDRLSTRGRGTYEQDNSPVFILADRGTGQRYVIPAKGAGESTIRLLLADRKAELLTVYTNGFPAYEPLDEDDAFDHEYVVHGDGEYVDGDVHVNYVREPPVADATVTLSASRHLKRQTHAVSQSVPAPT